MRELTQHWGRERAPEPTARRRLGLEGADPEPDAGPSGDSPSLSRKWVWQPERNASRMSVSRRKPAVLFFACAGSARSQDRREEVSG